MPLDIDRYILFRDKSTFITINIYIIIIIIIVLLCNPYGYHFISA